MRNSDPYAGIFYLMGIVFGAVVIISLLKGWSRGSEGRDDVDSYFSNRMLRINGNINKA